METLLFTTTSPFHSIPPSHHKMSPPRPPVPGSKNQLPGHPNPALSAAFPFPSPLHTPNLSVPATTTTPDLTTLTTDLLTFKKDLDALRLRVKQLHALTATPPIPSQPQDPAPSTFPNDLLTFKSQLDKLRNRLKEVTALTIATTVARTIATTTQNSAPTPQEPNNQGLATRLPTTLLKELRALLHATLEKVVWLRAAQHRGGGGGDALGFNFGLGSVGGGGGSAGVPGAERRAFRRSGGGGGGGHGGSGHGGGGHSGRADPVQDVMDRLGVAMSGVPGSGTGHTRSAGVGVGLGAVGEQMSVPSVSVSAGLGMGLGGRAAVRGLRGMVERAGVGEFFLPFPPFLDVGMSDFLWRLR